MRCLGGRYAPGTRQFGGFRLSFGLTSGRLRTRMCRTHCFGRHVSDARCRTRCRRQCRAAGGWVVLAGRSLPATGLRTCGGLRIMRQVADMRPRGAARAVSESSRTSLRSLTTPRDQRLPNRSWGLRCGAVDVLRGAGWCGCYADRAFTAGLRLSEPRRAPSIRGAAASERRVRAPMRTWLRGRPDGRPVPGCGAAGPRRRSARP